MFNASPAPADNVSLLKLRLDGGKVAIGALTKSLIDKGFKACSKFLAASETQDWMSNFELVVIDDLMSECGFGLPYEIGGKTIDFITSGVECKTCVGL